MSWKILPAAVLALSASPALAATDAEVTAAIASFNAAAQYPLPVLGAAQRKKLLDGDVVKVVDSAADGSGARRAVGLMVTDVDRDAMWVACQDPHFSTTSVVNEYRVSFTPPDKALWYGILDLPMGFSDRHWLVSVRNNHALAEATGNAAWEHPWKLVPGGVARVEDAVKAGKVENTSHSMWAEAIETPTNIGAWVAVALPSGGTLFAYHGATRVGGNIPEGLMLQYIKSTLDGLLRGVESRARSKVPGHYTAAHGATVVGGNGEAVATWPR